MLKQMLQCNKCGKGLRAYDGVIVEGNIYGVGETADERGGLVGNAFPVPDAEGRILVTDISECAFCWSCLGLVLEMPTDEGSL